MTVDYDDLEFMEVPSSIYPMFMGACELGEPDGGKYIALSPKSHPVIDMLKLTLEG